VDQDLAARWVSRRPPLKPWFERVLAAVGTCEEAVVAPFLVSLRPVAAREVPAAIRKRLARAWQRELAERIPFEELWGHPAPALVPAALLAEVLGSFDDGGRLLDDREWEYLARQGGRGTWVASPIDTSEHDLGLRGLGAPAWIEGGTGVRGGGWDTWPWQDRTESLHTVAGARPDLAIDGHGRFVWRARSLATAVAPEGDLAQLDIERPADPGPELAELLRDLTSDDPVPWRRALGRLHKRAASGDPAIGAIVAELLVLLGGASIREEAVRRARIAAFAAEIAVCWTETDREGQRERCREPLTALDGDAVPEVAEAARRIAEVLGGSGSRR
jgi:hypothetical protein